MLYTMANKSFKKSEKTEHCVTNTNISYKLFNIHHKKITTNRDYTHLRDKASI